MYDDIKFDLLDSLSTIEFYRNRKVSPAGPIRRQDIKIGGCHLAFSHLLKYRARAEPGVKLKMRPLLYSALSLP